MNNIEHMGYWWLPHNPDKKVAGILTFSQEDGGKLELIGSFRDVIMSFNDNGSYPIVLGQTTNGKLVTLKDCFEINYTFSMASTQKSTLHVNFVYIDIHISEEEDFKFSKIQANFTYLYDWVGISGISSDYFKDYKNVQFNYKMPENITIPINDGIVEITFGANIKSNYDFANLNENTVFFIKYNNVKNFNEISQDYIFPLQSLISLGTAKPNFVEELYFFHPDSEKTPIAVYYAQHFYKPKVKDHLIRHDMLFTLRDIFLNLEFRLNKWMILAKEIDSVLHLFNRVNIASEMYAELKFLSIAQAIETYHRTKKVNSFVSPKVHKERVERILKYLPKKHKEFVSQKITNNEKSLLVRLVELSEPKVKIMRPITGDLDEFTKKVRDSRNYYTHYGKSKKKKSAHGIHLHWITQKLIILLQACLLEELDFSLDEQLELFGKYEYYNRMKAKFHNSQGKEF